MSVRPQNNPEPDPAVMARAVAGDAIAASDLLRQFGPIVRGRIEGKISKVWQSTLEADDVMQVTYLEAFLQFPKFTPTGPGCFVAWLTRIAENNLRDAVKELEAAKRPDPRRQVRGSDRPDERSYVALVELMGVTHTTPSRVVGVGEIRGALDAALDKLPPDYALVIRLYDLACLDAGEVAARMKKTTGAMYMTLSRARDRLREVLGSESDFFSVKG